MSAQLAVAPSEQLLGEALQADCTKLLTEDLHHGWKIGNLRIENPYATH
jgi:predicted nucleic acid-binding protein